MTEKYYTDKANQMKLKRLREHPAINRTQLRMMETIIEMVEQAPLFQPIIKRVHKNTFDKYFMYLMGCQSKGILGLKQELRKCGIEFEFSSWEETDTKRPITTAFTIAAGEVEKENGYYMKFIRQ